MERVIYHLAYADIRTTLLEVQSFRCKIKKEKEGILSEKNYIKLTGNFYFDPLKKNILKKQGSSYIFVLNDRRRNEKPVSKDRRKGAAETVPVHLKPIIQGLYWDAANKQVYKKLGGNFVLFSKDRRKAHGPSPTGHERRTGHSHKTH